MSRSELWEIEAYMLAEESVSAMVFVVAVLTSAIGSQLDGLIWC